VAQAGIAAIPQYLRAFIGNNLGLESRLSMQEAGGTRTVTLADGSTLQTAAADGGIGQELALVGTHEPDSSAHYRALLGRVAEAVDEPWVLEIGANVGYFALMAAQAAPTAQLVAVEPAPQNLALLRANIEAAGLTDRISVHQAAVSDTVGQASLQLSQRSNHHGLEASDRPVTATVEVPTLPFDAAVDRWLPVAPHVVRMDVEGHEWAVLETMDAVLTGTEPLVLYIEVHPKLLGPERLAAVVERLAASSCRLEAIRAEAYMGRTVRSLSTLAELCATHPTDGFGYEVIMTRGLDGRASP
jgi:FkbM family methyltransferase